MKLADRRHWSPALKVVGAAVGLSSGTAWADGGFISPGLLASWTFGERGGFGIGGELSWMHLRSQTAGGPVPVPLPIHYGAFLQAEKIWSTTFSRSGFRAQAASPAPALRGE